tara:strand:+ start:256 stop:651 length:396 start_codon:yes stop_codon:yes gene_type:complete
MANTSIGNWTIVFEDKLIIKQSGDAAGTAYNISDDSFWSDSKFSNIWAIQHGTSITSNEVEYRDTTPHSSFIDANIGDISQFINKWDSHHLSVLQSNWDADNVVNEDGSSNETEAEKIARLGARPTSYISS